MNFEGKQNSICKQILQKMLSMLSKLKLLKKKYLIQYLTVLKGPAIFVYYIHLISEILTNF